MKLYTNGEYMVMTFHLKKIRKNFTTKNKS